MCDERETSRAEGARYYSRRDTRMPDETRTGSLFDALTTKGTAFTVAERRRATVCWACCRPR